MTVGERLKNIARNLNTLTKLHLDSEREQSDREYRERFAANETRLAQLVDTMNRLVRINGNHG